MKIFFFLFAAIGHFIWARWLFRRFPALENKKTLVYGVGLFFSMLSPVARSLHIRSEVKALILAASAIELMTILISGALLGLLTLASLGFDAGRRLARPDEGAARVGEGASSDGNALPLPIETRREETPARDDGDAPSRLSRREALERVGGFAVLAGTGSMLGWGMVRGRHAFEIEEVVVKIAGLPKALDGYTLAQVSDIHVGTFVMERELGEGLALVQKIRPDLIVATGDLVDYDPAYVALMAQTLGALQARDGVVAILGNHDYYTDARAITSALRRASVRVLVNDALHLRKDDGGGFALLGVDDYMGVRSNGTAGPRLDLAIAKAPPDRARILLAHQPRFFEDSAGQVALQLSGHTHGGQINPGITPAHLFMEFVKGRYERNGSSLWVNRGFGTAGPPSRVGAPPEVTKIVLVSA